MHAGALAAAKRSTYRLKDMETLFTNASNREVIINGEVIQPGETVRFRKAKADHFSLTLLWFRDS